MQYYGPGAGMPNPIEGLLQNGYAFLQMGNFPAASDCFSRAINMDLKNVHAQNGLILAELRMPSMAALESSTVFFHNTNAYKFIVANCDDARRAQLTSLLEKIKANAINVMGQAMNARAFADARAIAMGILSYDQKSERALLNSFLCDVQMVSTDELYNSPMPYMAIPSYKALYNGASEPMKELLDKISSFRLEWITKNLALAKEARDFNMVKTLSIALVDIKPSAKEAGRDVLLATLGIAGIDELGSIKKPFDSMPEYKQYIGYFGADEANKINDANKKLKKKKKKKLTVLLTSIGVLVLAIVTGLIVYFNSNMYKYETRKVSGGVEIVSYRGKDTDLEIPSKIGGKKVVAIADRAFSNRNLTSVTIPEGVKTIGEGAFRYNYRLTSVTISDGVERIESEAFYGCTNLKAVYIPSTVEEMGEYAFGGLGDIKIFVQHESGPIGWEAFWCYDSHSARVYWGVDGYGETDDFSWILDEDTNEITIVSYNGYASELTIPAALDGYAVVKIADEAIYNNDSLTKIIFEDGIREIGEKSFYDCDYLREVFIPASVEKIGSQAFYYGNSMTIYCAVSEKPYAWSSNWNGGNTVVWGCEGIETIGDYTVKYDNLGNAVITSYSGSASELNIPSNLGQYTVVGIENRAFYNFDTITKLVIPSTVKSIGEYAFYDCDGLQTVLIPSSVQYIGNSAFYYGNSLVIYCEASEKPSNWNNNWYGGYSASVVWNAKGGGISSNGYKYSYNASGEATILGYTNSISGSFEIPSTIDGYRVTGIGNSAFYNYDGMTEVIIPNTVVSIGDQVFYDCDSLSKATIPASVEKMGYRVFYYGNGLKIYCAGYETENWDSGWNGSGAQVLWGYVDELTVGDYEIYYDGYGNATISSYTGSASYLEIPETIGGYTVVRIAPYAFYDVNSLETVLIPSTVVEIGSQAFYDCDYLQTAYVPASVEKMGNYVFYYGNSLKIYCEATENGPEWSSSWMNSDIIAYWGYAGTGSIGNYEFYYDLNGNATITAYNGSESTVEIPSTLGGYTVIRIADKAFYNEDTITSVSIPDTVIEIGSQAFYDCDYLQSAYVPASVEKMGYRVFYYGNNLKVYCEVEEAPQGWDGTWYGNSATPIWNVGEVVLSGDYCLITKNDGTAQICSYIGNAKMLEIPSAIDGYTVSSIGEDAFYNCDSLYGVIIPDTVVEIGDNAFYDCDSLRFAYIPDSVSYMGYYVFYYGSNLKVYCEASSKPSEWDYDWYGNYSISPIWSITKERDEDNFSYTVSGGTATITGYYGTAKYVNIPSEIDGYTVTGIYEEAFYSEDSIYILIIPDTVTSIGEYAFYDCDYLREVYIPISVSSIDYRVFYYGNGNRIYCEASSRPSGWNSSWCNSSNASIYWEVYDE